MAGRVAAGSSGIASALHVYVKILANFYTYE